MASRSPYQTTRRSKPRIYFHAGANEEEDNEHHYGERATVIPRGQAGTSTFGLGRHLRDTASVDTGGGKDSPRTCAADQPLVAGSIVRDVPRAVHLANPLWRHEFSNRLRLHRPQSEVADEQR